MGAVSPELNLVFPSGLCGPRGDAHVPSPLLIAALD
jgi:hypothetical protein